jgi:two-component system, NtrC family, sensor kinase
MIRAYQNDSIEEIDALAEEVDLPFVLEDFSNVLRSMTSGTERIEEIVSLLGQDWDC